MSQYVVTMRWFVESDESLEDEMKNLNIEAKNEKVLDILRHRTNGSESCGSCPTRNNESATILNWKDFYDKKPIYMNIEKTKSTTD